MKVKLQKSIVLLIGVFLLSNAQGQTDLDTTEENIEVLKSFDESRRNREIKSWVETAGFTTGGIGVIGYIASVVKINHYKKQAELLAKEAAVDFIEKLPEHVVEKLNLFFPASRLSISSWEFLYVVQRHLVEIFSGGANENLLTEGMKNLLSSNGIQRSGFPTTEVLKVLDTQYDHLLNQLTNPADKTKATMIKELWDGLFYLANADKWTGVISSNESLVVQNLQNPMLKMYMALENIGTQILKSRSEEFIKKPVVDKFMVKAAENIDVLIGQTNIEESLARTRFSVANLLKFQQYATSVTDFIKLMRSGGNPMGNELIKGVKNFADEIDLFSKAGKICAAIAAVGVSVGVTTYFLNKEHNDEEREFEEIGHEKLLEEISPTLLTGVFENNRVPLEEEEAFNEVVNGVRKTFEYDCDFQSSFMIDMKM